MKFLDLTLPSPAENLASDEVLLEACEENGGQEILRFWEAHEPFIVVGYANKIATEVNVVACKERNIPIFRRCSGGGTVLQGAGCLNYALILQITENSPLTGISSANRFIMEKNRAAIESEVRGRRPEAGILVCGHTDLSLVTRHSSPITSKKFSGNSQRRKKNFLLFHGTFLLNLDVALMSELLRMPSKQPDYRQSRSHDEFLTNLNLPAAGIKNALKKNWSVTEELPDFPKAEIQKLAAKKYSTNEWNFKF